MSGFKNFLTSPRAGERQRRARVEGMKTAREQGSFLTEPVTQCPVVEFSSPADGDGDGFRGAGGGMQGWRVANEDAHIIHEAPGGRVIMGMYDGHGGRGVAEWLAAHLHPALESLPHDSAKDALPQVFAALDAQLRGDEGGGGGAAAGATGATCNVCIVGGMDIICANAGDCRAVLCRRGYAVPLSFDHNPTDAKEVRRIERSGSSIKNNRIDGMLNVSRAFGDFDFKAADSPAEDQAVTPLCDVTQTAREDGDTFIVQACDGVWGALSSQEVIDFIREVDPVATPLGSVIERLCRKCLAGDSAALSGTDNMSVNILMLN